MHTNSRKLKKKIKTEDGYAFLTYNIAGLS